jgi:hypothetical protein
MGGPPCDVVPALAGKRSQWHHGSMTTTIDEIALLVRQALLVEDLSAFSELLDPNVTWGARGARRPTCTNRNQVLAWYQRGREAGVTGSVHEIEVLDDRLLVSMTVRGTETAQERGGEALRFQVLTIRNGKVVDIAGFDEKVEAISYRNA